MTVTSIPSGIPSQPPATPKNSKVRFAGSVGDTFKAALYGKEGRGSQTSFIQEGGFGKGLKRAAEMIYKRPLRGWPQVILHFLTGVSLILPIKHFFEGLIGANSFYFVRRLGKGTVSQSANKDNRTIIGAFKQLWANFKNRKEIIPALKEVEATAAKKAAEAAKKAETTAAT